MTLCILKRFTTTTEDGHRSPGLVVMGGDSRYDIVGSNPSSAYWMDMTFFHIDLLYELYFLFEKTENKRKLNTKNNLFEMFMNFL